MLNITARDPWFPYHRSNTAARLRLFCFPYAGGSASIFRTWLDQFPSGVDVSPIQYPGRESRLKEPPFTRLEALIEQLAQAIRPYLNLPFIFFGHSLGGLVSFELTRRLRREGSALPSHLFVSGARAPQIPDPDPPIHQLPDAEFAAELRRLNGTPEAVLQHADLMQLLMPVLRADFAAIETYRHFAEEPLDCPISAFGGTSDREVTEAHVAAWREQTRQVFDMHMLSGDHFFIHSAKDLLLKILAQQISTRYLGGTRLPS